MAKHRTYSVDVRVTLIENKNYTLFRDKKIIFIPKGLKTKDFNTYMFGSLYQMFSQVYDTGTFKFEILDYNRLSL